MLVVKKRYPRLNQLTYFSYMCFFVIVHNYQVNSIVLVKRNTKGNGKAILRINASGLQKLEDTK